MSQRAPWKSGTAYSWTMLIFNSSGAGVTGRAGSVTTKLAKDDAVSAVSVTVTEIDSSNLPGWYKVVYTPSSTGHWVCTAIDTANMTAPWLDEIQATTSDLYALVLDSSGRPGVDWSNVGAPNTNLNLSNTTISGVSGSVAVVGSVSGDVGGKVLGGGSSSLSAVGVKSDVEQWKGSTPNSLTSGRVDASIGSVDAGAITGPAFGTGALGAVWDELIVSHSTSSTFGKFLGNFLNLASFSSANNLRVDVEEWKASVPNNLSSGRVDASVGAVAVGALAQIAAVILATPGNLLATDGSGRVTVGTVAANAIDAAQITAGAAQFLADQLLDRAGALEGVATVRQGLQWIAAAVAGKNAPASTRLAPSYLGLDDATTRLSATVDATTGQRTAVTRS